jgi:2-succinyl-6-hydroxy-2,4-cyclohexadiene-1-carboxylate synthase
MPLLTHPAHVSAETRARQHAQRLENNPLGLANNLRGMGAGQQTPLWSRLPTLRTPSLLLAGEHDLRYRGIAERIHALVPASDLGIVAGAGHTIHVDQPQEFVTRVGHTLGKEATRN